MKKKNIIIILILLMLFSLINNYSARFMLKSYESYFVKELIWYLASFFIVYIISKINSKAIFKYSLFIYICGNLLLALTMIIGTKVNGSTSWISLGGFSIQPSEFMKIALIMYLYTTHIKYKDLPDYKYILLTVTITLIPSILTFLEPDTGAVIIYLIILLTFLILKKLNKWWYIISVALFTIFITSFFLLYYKYSQTFINIFGTSFFYRMDRITDFISGDGYQINKALISIGTSGLFGRGLRNIPEYFPEAPTDFAFTLLINNIGIIGIIIFLIIYSLLFYYLIKGINKKNITFVLPIVLILLFQFSINILMNIGLVPIIGIALPFLSYGGSNLLSYMILIGLVLNKIPENN